MNLLEKPSSMKNNLNIDIEKENSDEFYFEKFSEKCKNCQEFGMCNECKARLTRFKGRSLCENGYYYFNYGCYRCIPHCKECTNDHSCYDCEPGYIYKNHECEEKDDDAVSRSSMFVGVLVGVIIGTVIGICAIICL